VVCGNTSVLDDELNTYLPWRLFTGGFFGGLEVKFSFSRKFSSPSPDLGKRSLEYPSLGLHEVSIPFPGWAGLWKKRAINCHSN